MNNKKTLFSGIQPSGNLTIGNYVGALKNWVLMQDDYNCFYCIVDLHAITVKQSPDQLRKQCYDCLALLIACGIDPDKSTIFLQSQVSEHSVLTWILNCFTNMGELNRMTQFKDKSKQHKSNINIGLFDYPVLQAADILLYETNIVPVGADQKQHIELCRDIAIRFNNTYGDVLTIPEYFAPKIGSRLMSLQDPLKKMSKSDENKNNFVAILDSKDVILSKLKRAVTDSEKEVIYDSIKKAGISNLMTLYSLTTNTSISDIEKEFNNKGYGDFKIAVANAIIEFLHPIQEKFNKLRQNESMLNKVLEKGKQNAKSKAKSLIEKVHSKIGFII